MGKLNSKGFSVVEGILIFLIVAIVGGTGYYVYHANKTANKNLTPTATGNPSFKKNAKTASTTNATYTSTASGYSVQYPNQWSKEESTSTEGPTNKITGYRVSFKSPDYQRTSGHFPVAMSGGEFFILQTQTNATSISDYTDNDSADQGISWPAESSQTTVDGVSALRGTCNDAGGPSICVSFVKSGKYFTLYYYYSNQESASIAKYLKEFNSFVESFKFN